MEDKLLVTCLAIDAKESLVSGSAPDKVLWQFCEHNVCEVSAFDAMESSANTFDAHAEGREVEAIDLAVLSLYPTTHRGEQLKER